MCRFVKRNDEYCRNKPSKDGLCMLYSKTMQREKEQKEKEQKEKEQQTQCVELTYKGIRCIRKCTIGDLCTFHYNKKICVDLPAPPRQDVVMLLHDGETKSCNNTEKFHKSSGSHYPKDKVPIEKFKKEGKSKLCDTCDDCRTYRNNFKINADKNMEKKNQEQIEKDPNFGICFSNSHDVQGVSIYPRNKVPIEKF